MRRFKQTKDVLDYVRKFHGQLSEYYDSMSQIAEKERVKMLLDYLSRHEKHIEASVAEFEKDASKNILNTWFQFMPKNFPPDCFEKNGLKPNMSVDEVITVALHFDDCLVELYKVMAKEAEISEVKDLFTTLLKMEQQEERTLARDSLWLKDM